MLIGKTWDGHKVTIHQSPTGTVYVTIQNPPDIPHETINFNGNSLHEFLRTIGYKKA